MDASARMRAMVNGYQVSQALSVAASLRLSDHLADGPRTVGDLAAATGSHEPTLGRLLRALATVGVYAREDDGRFSLTALGATLRSDVPGSVAGWARLVGRPPLRAGLERAGGQRADRRERLLLGARDLGLGVPGRPPGGAGDLRPRHDVADRRRR